MHQICIASVMHLQCTCIKSGKYCNPDIATPHFRAFLPIKSPCSKIMFSCKKVTLQCTWNALALHLLCICIIRLVFSIFRNRIFRLLGRFLHLQCIWNALALHLHQEKIWRNACYIKYNRYLCTVLL